MPFSNSKVLFIKADANSKIGFGHFIRSFALGQSWIEAGGSVSFITRCENEDLVELLHTNHFAVHRLNETNPDQDFVETKKILELFPGVPIVLDGYSYDESFRTRIRSTNHPVLYIDDYAREGSHSCDITLNQNSFSDSNNLPQSNRHLSLLGSKYALLRREFREFRSKNTYLVRPSADRILISCGGSDPKNTCTKILKGLNLISHCKLAIKVILGSAFQARKQVEQICASSPHQIELLTSPKNMVIPMSWADLAIVTSGSTVWELSCLGVPMVVIPSVDNQVRIAEDLDYRGAAIRIQDLNEVVCAKQISEILLSYKKRTEMSKIARILVDGNGNQRVLSALGALKPLNTANDVILNGQ